MDAPVDMQERSGFGNPRQDAPVDHRDQMSVSDLVEDVPRPRPINATDEYIAIERRAEPVACQERFRHSGDSEVVCCMCLTDKPFRNCDLAESIIGIRWKGAECPIKIALLDPVVVDERQVLN